MARRGRFGERLHRRMQRSALLLAVVLTVASGLAITGITWWVLWLVLGAHTQQPNQVDLSRIALSVAAGVGGAVALVVAYRRQRDNERGRFAEVFGAAARQLGDTDVAVRVAGVYAMAGVADEFAIRGRRQQCIDVLCGYLRLPYDPAEGTSHLASQTRKFDVDGTEIARTYQVRQNDGEVRRTIVAVLAAHLRPSAEVSWSSYNFNFDDAVLEDVDFRHAVFAGGHTHFRGARFIGDRVANFEYVRFECRHVTFHNATFENRASFRNAGFVPARVDSRDTSRAGTSFANTTFAGRVGFDGAEFQGPRTTFSGASFVGAETTFTGARFAAATTAFDGATFDGARIRWDDTVFDSAGISFAGALFYAVHTTFLHARLGTRPRWRRDGTGVVDFGRAEYHGGVSFAGATFEGGIADFSEGDFFGEITFRRTRFACREVRFTDPRVWIGVQVDWDEHPEHKPAHVQPAAWPPIPAELPAAPSD